MAKWIRYSQPEQIAQKLNLIISINPTNSQITIALGYPEYSYDGLVIVLGNMVEMSNEISETRKSNILHDAIRSAKHKGDITERSLLGELSRLENMYIAQPKDNYVLASYISADNWFSKPKLADRRINGTTITFAHELPKRFFAGHQKIKTSAEKVIQRDFPSRYQSVRVRVAARSAADAFETALNGLDLQRAIWNFAINPTFGLHSRLSGGVPMPINPLVLGPLHTIHKPNGEIATEVWWYEPNYIMPVFPFNLQSKVANMYEHEMRIRKRLNRLPYHLHIEEILIQYVRALDETSWQNAFLALWRILEQLTAGGNHESTIKRTTFLFEDVEYHEQILKHLRHQRNALVHEGNTSIFFETLAYQTKFYVDLLLEFHLTNRFGFSSLKEVAEMLDSSTDADVLRRELTRQKRELKLIEKTMKYRNVS